MAAGGASGRFVPRPDQVVQAARGAVVPGERAGIFRGRLVVIFGSGAGSGLFDYSPSPAAGKLILSITSANITDPYGNKTLPPLAVYRAGTPFQAANLTASGLSFNTAASEAGPWTQVATVSSDTAGNVAFSGVSLLLLPDTLTNGRLSFSSIATPAQLAGNAVAYAGNDVLRYVDGGDGNDYATGMIATRSATSQAITSTTLAQVENMTASVAARVYKLDGSVYCTQGATAAAQNFAIVLGGGATVSFARLDFVFTQEGAGPLSPEGPGHLTASLATMVSAAYSAGVTFKLQFSGIIVFTAGGSFSVQAAEGTAGDSFTVTGSWMTLANT